MLTQANLFKPVVKLLFTQEVQEGASYFENNEKPKFLLFTPHFLACVCV